MSANRISCRQDSCFARQRANNASFGDRNRLLLHYLEKRLLLRSHFIELVNATASIMSTKQGPGLKCKVIAWFFNQRNLSLNIEPIQFNLCNAHWLKLVWDENRFISFYSKTGASRRISAHVNASIGNASARLQHLTLSQTRIADHKNVRIRAHRNVI